MNERFINLFASVHQCVEEGVPKREGVDEAGAEEPKPPPPNADPAVCMRLLKFLNKQRFHQFV